MYKEVQKAATAWNMKELFTFGLQGKKSPLESENRLQALGHASSQTEINQRAIDRKQQEVTAK